MAYPPPPNYSFYRTNNGSPYNYPPVPLPAAYHPLHSTQYESIDLEDKAAYAPDYIERSRKSTKAAVAYVLCRKIVGIIVMLVVFGMFGAFFSFAMNKAREREESKLITVTYTL